MERVLLVMVSLSTVLVAQQSEPKTTGPSPAFTNLTVGAKTGYVPIATPAYTTTAVNFFGSLNPPALTATETNPFQFLVQDSNNTIPNIAALYSTMIDNHISGVRASSVGFEGDALMENSGTIKGLAGTVGFSQTDSGNVTTSHGIHGTANSNAGVTQELAGLYGQSWMSGGTVTNAYSAFLASPLRTGGTLKNNYGLYIQAVGTSGSIRNHALYIQDGPFVFTQGGRLGIGGEPSYRLHVYGGNTTNALIAGVTTGLRITANPAGVSIDGTDNTGGISYRPIVVNGSQVQLSIANIAALSINSGGNAAFSGALTAPSYKSASNCSSSASPAVCGSAAAGSISIGVGATSVTVNTTAVTTNSQILVIQDDSLGPKLGVTCYTATNTMPRITARSSGKSFTIMAAAPTTNPACYSYGIVN